MEEQKRAEEHFKMEESKIKIAHEEAQKKLELASRLQVKLPLGRSANLLYLFIDGGRSTIARNSKN